MLTLSILHGAALVVATLGAVWDWRRGEIPNGLTLPVVAIAPVLHGLLLGPMGVARSVLAALCCGLVPYVLFRAGAGGGGDVKLFAALGALTGLSMGLEIELTAFIAAAVLAMGRLAWQGALLRTLLNAFFLAVNPVLPRKWRRTVEPELMATVRLGVPIAVAATLVVVGRHAAPWLGV